MTKIPVIESLAIDIYDQILDGKLNPGDVIGAAVLLLGKDHPTVKKAVEVFQCEVPDAAVFFRNWRFPVTPNE